MSSIKIEHVAIWTTHLEVMREFYVRWFGVQHNDKYSRTDFESYFLRFEDGARLELMQRPGLHMRSGDHRHPSVGFVHIAIAVGSREKVDSLTKELRHAGVSILSGPRETGDGYYETMILDPDSNIIEITV